MTSQYRWVQRETSRHGKVVWYFRNGGPRIRLVGEPGSAQFLLSYEAAIEGASSRVTRAIAPDGYVYFVRFARGPYKIGYSETPTKRLASLCSGNPQEVDSWFVVRGTHEDEERVHAVFAAHRQRGEHFRATRSLQAFIAQAVVHGVDAALREAEAAEQIKERRRVPHLFRAPALPCGASS